MKIFAVNPMTYNQKPNKSFGIGVKPFIDRGVSDPGVIASAVTRVSSVDLPVVIGRNLQDAMDSGEPGTAFAELEKVLTPRESFLLKSLGEYREDGM